MAEYNSISTHIYYWPTRRSPKTRLVRACANLEHVLVHCLAWTCTVVLSAKGQVTRLSSFIFR